LSLLFQRLGGQQDLGIRVGVFSEWPCGLKPLKSLCSPKMATVTKPPLASEAPRLNQFDPD
jgi:hypothetical protein